MAGKSNAKLAARTAIVLSLLCAAWLGCTPGVCRADEVIEFEFTQDGSNYSMRAEFLTQAPEACVISVLFEYRHLVNFVTGVDSLMLFREGEGWYDVGYFFSNALVKVRSNYRKVLNESENEITFEMIETEHKGRFVPKLVSSSGHYRVTPKRYGCEVSYFQEARIESGVLKRFYLGRTKKESIKFMHELRDYIDRVCRG